MKFITNRKDVHKSILESEEIVLATLEELMEWRKSHSLVFMDTETNTLDTRKGDILLYQFGDWKEQFVVDATTINLEQSFFEDATFVLHNAMFDYNQMKKKRIIIKRVYDTMLAAMVLTQGLYDAEYIRTMHPYRLSEIVLEATGHELNKGIRGDFSRINPDNFSSLMTADLIKYSAEDVKYLDPAFEYLNNKIKNYDLEATIDLENRYVLAFADMIYNGVKLDTEKWLKLEKEKIKERDEMYFTIDDLLIKEVPAVETELLNPKALQFDLFSNNIRHRKLRINYNSSKQVSDIIENRLKMKITDKHGAKTVGIKELKKVKNKSAFVESYIGLKELEKRISSFGSNFLEFINPNTGRIHSAFQTQILDTGRTALREPNLYQIPQDNAYRNCFIGEYKDRYKYFYVGGDYAAQEGRIMADKAKDTAYIEFFNTGDGDAHSFVATKMFSAQYGREFIVKGKSLQVEVLKGENAEEVYARFGKLSKVNPKWDKQGVFNLDKSYIIIDLSEKNVWRQNGKILNFFLSFGGSAFTLSMELGISMEEASALIKAFFDGFPTLKEMFNKEANFAIVNGYTITNPITKRRRWYSQWEEMKTTQKWIDQQKANLGQNFWDQIKDKNSLLAKENRKVYILKGEIERAAQNTPIQGTAADMSKTAMVLEREKLIDANILPFDDAVIKIVLMPHDEIQTEVREDYIELASQILQDSMDEAGKVFVKTISLRPEIEVNPYWKK